MAITGGYALDMSTLERRLRWTFAALVLISLAALVSHIFGILPMVYFLTFGVHINDIIVFVYRNGDLITLFKRLKFVTLIHLI